MGNSATKEARPAQRSRPTSVHTSSATDPTALRQTAANNAVQTLYGGGGRAVRVSGRPDLGFSFGLGGGDSSTAEQRRETKQEREARKAEKEKQEREKERERSLKEEHVDGGYLVTLGTYTGPEDFNKTVVRQLQIERRLAPFWKGLNDHKDEWAEHQIVAAVRGLPIPAADEVPPELERAQIPDADVHRATLPIGGRTLSSQSDRATSLSASHPAFSSGSPASPSGMSSGMALFRGRARTLASLTSASRSGSTTNLAPPESQLPKDPFINGQPIEAYLYKDAQECPICFLYYPPYLNKTRCCDQPICSECFVQIKRPDPHAPEHHEPATAPPPEETKPEEENLLVSEPSACPFCVTPEFGVTYEPPSFRRGLTYVGTALHPLQSHTSAMSSSTSLGSMVSRRRTHSLSANDKSVITTDKVRPDWATKLADARAHALRRAAAATALHNAAYMLGNTQNIDLRAFGRSRRRRGLFGENTSATQSSTDIAGQTETPQSGEESGRVLGSRSRAHDLEDLMMMEAIRLSLAAEDERKKKEEKEAAKEAKKKAKQDAKEAKKADKAAKKADKASSLYAASTNQSTSTWASTSMTRSTSNLGYGSGTASPMSPLGPGKGKAPASQHETAAPLSKVETSRSTASYQSRSGHLQPSQPIPLPGSAGRSRALSAASSVGSSMLESGNGSPSTSTNVVEGQAGHSGSSTPQQQQASEPMFNFRSLAAMIGEEKEDNHAEHHEISEENLETPMADHKAEDEIFPATHIDGRADDAGEGSSTDSS